MTTYFLGKKTQHINHNQCTPVHILETDGDFAFVAALAVGPTWDTTWVPLSSLHDVNTNIIPQEPPLDKGYQTTDLGRHVTVYGGEVLEV